jgi:hypothetical protein
MASVEKLDKRWEAAARSPSTDPVGMGRIVGAAIKERAADGPIRLIQLKFQSFNMSATLGGPVPRRLSPERFSTAGERHRHLNQG